MELLYNIDFEVAAAGFDLILIIYLSLFYKNISKSNLVFHRLTFAIFIADILDVISAITISYGRTISPTLNLVINSLYFISVMAAAYIFYLYVYSYIEEAGAVLTSAKYNFIAFLAGICFVIANIFGGFIFDFDDAGTYIHGRLYPLFYLLPMYFAVVSVCMIVKYRKCFTRTQFFADILYIVCAILGNLIQMFVFKDVLLTVFLASFALLIVFFTLETPDYKKLIKTMDELSVAKEEAESEREKAMVANAAKSDFLSNMSHEIRTPINAIMGYNEMIMQETKESQTTAYGVNVQAAGKTLLSIVNDILDFTSIDEGRLVIENAPYSMPVFLQDVLTYSEYNAKQKNLELKYEIDEKLPVELKGDERRLMQIFNNLLSNAIKYTKEGFISFSIGWKQTGDNTGLMSVIIKDSGIGIKPDDMSKISTGSFSRFDNRQTRNIQGIGLGLSVVVRLLEMMGSSLKVKSEYGKGSEFAFEVKQEVVSSKTIGKFDINSQLGGVVLDEDNVFYAPDARILAVDDNTMNLDLFKRIMRNTKADIDTAMNGREAIDLIERNDYDIIFLDHMMPVMDGMETLLEIKERSLAENTKIIAFTANAVSGEKNMYLDAGFDDYITKPITGKKLIDLVKHYLPEEKISDKLTAASENEIKIVKNQSTGATGGIIDLNDLTTDVPERNKPVEYEKPFLESISFLDTVTGLTYCCNDEDFYREMLTSYLNESKLKELNDYFASSDWDNYRIKVHALKSTSLSIGAVELSESARALEAAAKEGDEEYIKAHHEETMTDYSRLLQMIEGVLATKEKVIVDEALIQEDKDVILVVDDDRINLEIAKKILASRFTVKCASSGRGTLEFLSKEIPSLVMLDLHMPDMDGFEVISMLKADARYRDIPVIFLTADSDRDTEIMGFKEGALDFITKPFIAEIMLQRVGRILELDRLQKKLQTEVEKQTHKAEARRQKVERLSLQVMKTLAATIDAKDKYTNGHSVRVAEYSKAIAARYGKNEKEQEDIYYMGLLHDVGKIGIPDEIINKTSKLTDEEYAVIKTHPSIGADILKNISEIPDIGIGARWHHERYDGKGYPDGLLGEQIPETARIIGVADAYDAMTSKRSYRDVLSQEIVRGEIERGRGSQFDPKFADVMLQLIDEDKEYKMHEQ